MPSVRSLRLDIIAEDLSANPLIQAVVPWGVYYGLKWREDVNGLYINTKILTDVLQSNRTMMEARVEFHFTGQEDSIPAEVHDAVDVVTNVLVNYWCWRKQNFEDGTGSITIQSVRQGSLMWPDYDHLNRVLMRKDYIFIYFANDDD